MNIIKSSIFYRMIQYVAAIHSYSMIYKTRKKEKRGRTNKVSTPYYRFSVIYKITEFISKLLRKICIAIHNGAKASSVIGYFGSAMLAMKKTKLWAFNQLIVSIIVGYTITNVALGVFTKMKLLYLSSFFVVLIGMNVYCMLYKNYKKTSLLVKLYRYVTQ